MKSAFLKIIKNSIEALDGRKQKLIQITYEEEGDLHILRILDSGDGISEDIQKEVFDPMFTTKSELGHSGLGLSISRKIVNLCGGQLVCIKSNGNPFYSLQITLKKGSEIV